MRVVVSLGNNNSFNYFGSSCFQIAPYSCNHTQSIFIDKVFKCSLLLSHALAYISSVVGKQLFNLIIAMRLSHSMTVTQRLLFQYLIS